jgi:uncharacterized protein (TIGR03084 family)
MNDVLNAVLADLAAEGEALDAVVAELDAAAWRTATPAAGWDIAHQIAHLAWTDESAIKAATDKVAWDELVLSAIANPTGFVDDTAAEGAQAAPADLLARWRASRVDLAKVLVEFPVGEKLPWYGPPMSPTSMATARFMETWAHSRDVFEALGRTPEASDRVRHIVHLGARTRNYSFINRELTPPAEEFRVELVSPSGEVWTFGPEDAAQSVRGSALDFALLVTQRCHRDDTDLVAVGAEAEAWLGIAQAFAGPPGEGRPAKGGAA